MMLTVYAEDKKPAKPRQATPHFVGAGRPKKQTVKKQSDFDTKKWFSSTTILKKRKQKLIAKKKEEQEKCPFYQKNSTLDKRR